MQMQSDQGRPQGAELMRAPTGTKRLRCGRISGISKFILVLYKILVELLGEYDDIYLTQSQ